MIRFPREIELQRSENGAATHNPIEALSPRRTMFGEPLLAHPAEMRAVDATWHPTRCVSPSRRLIVPQGNDGIDTHRATGRHDARDQGNNSKKRGHHHECEWIERMDTKQQSGRSRGRDCRQWQSHTDANGDRTQRL